MTKVPSPETTAYLNTVQDTLEELRVLDGQMRRAKSPAAIDAMQRQMESMVSELGPAGDGWAREDLKEVYKRAFKSSGGRTIPSSAAGRALRERKKVQAGLRNGQKGLNGWVSTRARDAKVIKARGLYDDQLKKAESVLKRFPDNKDAQAKVSDLKARLAGLPKVSNTDAIPSIYYRNKKGEITSKQPAYQYYDMSTKTGYSMANNLGVIDGAADTAWFIVGDGPDCGWPGHKSGEMANGKIVNKEQALTAPLAHPNCQRSFEVAKGPPGSRKLQNQLKEIVGTAQRRQIDQVARVGHIFADTYSGYFYTTKLLGFARNNEITQTLVRHISLDDITILPKWAQRDVQQWFTSWIQREGLLLTKKGLTDLPEDIVSYAAVDLVNKEVVTEGFHGLRLSQVADIDDDVRQMLGLEKGASKAQVMRAAEEFADFVKHKQTKFMTQAEILQDNVISTTASTLIHASNEMKLLLNAPRGSITLGKINKSYDRIMTLLETEPEKLGVAAIRELAAQLDVLPWPKAQIGPFKFSAGISAEGRRDLAEALYKSMRAAVRYHPDEMSWAKSIGLHLTDKSITPRDIVEALIPRVSLEGGRIPASATIGLENGKLVPLFRLHPRGAILRQFAMEARLPTGEVLEYIKKIRGDLSEEGIRKALKDLSQDTLFTIDLFRHSPIMGQLKLRGAHLDRWAINSRPDMDWIGSMYRLYGRPLLEMSDDKKLKFYKAYREAGMTADQAMEAIRVADLPNKYKDRIFAPRRRGNTALSARPHDIVDTTMRLYAWQGNLVEAARAGGLALNDVLNMYFKYKEDFDATWFNFNLPLERARALPKRVRNIRSNLKIEAEILAKTAKNMASNATRRFGGAVKSLEDIPIVRVKTATERFEGTTFRQALADGPPTVDSTDRLNFLDADAIVDPVFRQDVNDFFRAWEYMFGPGKLPDIGVMDIEIDGQNFIPGRANYLPNGRHWIQIHGQAAKAWTKEFSAYMKKAGDIGYTANGENPLSVLWHESGHYLNANQTEDDFLDMWDAIAKYFDADADDVRWLTDDTLGGSEIFSPLDPRRTLLEERIWAMLMDVDGVEEKMMDVVSNYGASSPRELIAEIWLDYMMNESPSDLAHVVGRFLRKAAL